MARKGDMLKWGAVLMIIAGVGTTTFGQLPVSGFSAPASVCIGERLELVNTSLNASFYEWDFCEGDLFNTPTAQTIATLSGAFNPKEMDVVKDGDEWFGFVTSRTTNSIYRINYGPNLSNTTPSVTNLGNVGSAFSGPEQIRMIEEGDNWYALVINGTSSSLMRLSFGTSLESVPVIEPVLSNISAVNSGMDIGLANNEVVAVITNASTQVISIVNFGNSITNNPTASARLNVSAPAGAASPDDITLVHSGGMWYGFMVAFNSRTLYRLNFGPSLFSTPSIVLLTAPAFAVEERPSGIKVVQDKGEYVGFVQTFNGPLFRLDFGTSITNDNPANMRIGNLGVLANSVNLRLIKENSRWHGFVINQSNPTLARITFPDNCTANQLVSSQPDPYGIEYSSTGIQHISLVVKDQNKNTDYFHTSVSISSSTAPDISFTSQNICANHDVNFTSQNTSGNVVSYDWDFGDAKTSSQPNPINQFSAAGEYPVQLNVTADNGCQNLARQALTIFNQPLANFSMPSASPVCTNQSYWFENTSSFDEGYSPAWQWYVNGSPVSSEKDLAFSFSNTVDYELKLKASIPGCENEVVKTIDPVTEGPLVDFDFSGQCEDESVLFENKTVGDVTGYSWNFGDGQISSNENPQHAFTSPDQYQVTLSTLNAAGCQNTMTKPVSIYSKPQTNFSIPLPPFSCSGLPTPFSDLTPNPFDSNLSSWKWDFGDGVTSQLRNPQHSYESPGDYLVTLEATTNFGCSGIVGETVLISQAPSADFTHSPPCLGVPVSFTDGSIGAIQSWLWQIENASFTAANPVFSFTTSGPKSISLSVTDVNGCIGSKNVMLNVPQTLAPDFTFTKNCVNQQTEFTDVTNTIADPVVDREWTFTGLGTGTDNPQLFTFSGQGNYNVKLRVVTETGCEYTGQKNVAIGNSPQANFSATPHFGAPPLAVQFTNTSVGASGYLWRFNDQENSTSTLTSPSFTFTELGEYKVNLTAFNTQNCSHSLEKTIEVVVPFLDVALTQLELITLPGTILKPAVTIHNKSNIPVVNLPIRFDFSGGVIIREYVNASILPGATYRHVVDFDVQQSVELDFICAEAEVADNSPGDNRLCLAIQGSGFIFSPHPNPVFKNSDLQIDWVAGEQQSTEINIINALGQTISYIGVESKPGFNSRSLSTDGLQAGMYIIRITNGASASSFRIVVAE